MGAISDLIERINGHTVARVALAQSRGATLKSAPRLNIASVALIASEKSARQASLREDEIPISVTREYFADRGVHLLAEDLAFLRWHLPRATQSRNVAIGRYVKTWLHAAEAELVPHRKDNAGRFAANTWFREQDTERSYRSSSRTRSKISGALRQHQPESLSIEN